VFLPMGLGATEHLGQLDVHRRGASPADYVPARTAGRNSTQVSLRDSTRTRR